MTVAPAAPAATHADRLLGRLASREAPVVVVGQGSLRLSVLCGAATEGLTAAGLDGSHVHARARLPLDARDALSRRGSDRVVTP